MTTPRILFLQETQWGGVHSISQTLLEGLQAQGVEVTCVDWQATSFLSLLQAAKSHDVMVACHNFGPTYRAVGLKLLIGKKVVSWVHGPLREVLMQANTSWLKKLWLHWLYRHVDRFVCVSRTTQDSLLGFLGDRAASRSTVVPNGIAPMPQGQPLHVHAGHGGESGIPPLLLGYVGRLSAEKRPHWLLETLRELPDFAQLALVGDGPLHRKMAHDGMDLLAQGRLHFLGKHPRGASLYQPWQMTLLSSRYEGCPMTALESMACGVPCVALPIPALRELMDLDAPYLLARGDTPVALAEAVMTTLSLAPHKVQDDIARIVARHSVPQFVQGWQKVLQTC